MYTAGFNSQVEIEYKLLVDCTVNAYINMRIISMENGKRSISFLSFAIEMHFRNIDIEKKICF